MTNSMRVTMVAVAALAVAPAAAFAARAALPGHQMQARAAAPAPAHAAPYHAARIGPHAFFGTIVAMRGSRLVVQLRNGRTQPVDDTRAIAANDYSAPLFLGKLVAVDGTFSGGIFSAQHIYRLSNLQGLQNDH